MDAMRPPRWEFTNIGGKIGIIVHIGSMTYGVVSPFDHPEKYRA